jgi:hypothetical protein
MGTIGHEINCPRRLAPGYAQLNIQEILLQIQGICFALK